MKEAFLIALLLAPLGWAGWLAWKNDFGGRPRGRRAKLRSLAGLAAVVIGVPVALFVLYLLADVDVCARVPRPSLCW